MKLTDKEIDFLCKCVEASALLPPVCSRCPIETFCENYPDEKCPDIWKKYLYEKKRGLK